jgi:MFS-type transporter involved in bile tolerance (Atg22 family)
MEKGFGLHAAMDQTGAVVGPLLVAGAVARTHHFGPAFLWLALPALGAFVALLFARRRQYSIREHHSAAPT